MSRFLLDVNVIIALIDPSHMHADEAYRWFDDHGNNGWLTCPITENGAVRIDSNPNYRPGFVSVEEAVASVRSLRHLGRHQFVGDGISLTDDIYFDPSRITNFRRLTDA